MSDVKTFEPVALIRDLAPPEGRVTVELLDERGLRVIQREKSENAIMNHWTECVKAAARGAENNATGTYNFHGPGGDTLIATDTDVKLSVQGNGAAGQWWNRGIQDGGPVWGVPGYQQHHARSIILTDSAQTVDADEWMFPGNLNAFVYLPEVYAPSTNLARTQLVTASSYRTRTALRYVAEWGTAYGNGVHQSVGVGGVTWPSALSFAYQYPSLYASLNSATSLLAASTVVSAVNSSVWHNTSSFVPIMSFFNGVNTMVASTDVPNASGHRVSDTEWWTLVSGVAGNNLTKLNPMVATGQPFSTGAVGGLSVTGPTMTTIGSTTTRTGVCVVGTDLWLAYGTTLKRCVKPTNTSLTVSNTYAPSGVGTLVDITTDGTNIYWLTSTTVYVIDPTTGTTTSSWAHGLTGTMQNIAYGTTPGRLYISYIATGITAALWNSSNTAARTPLLCAMFSVAGVSQGTFAQTPHVSTTANVNSFVGGLLFPLDSANKHWVGWPVHNGGISSFPFMQILGPSHVSRTVLGSPVTKTSSNSMRLIYEFGF